MLNMKLYFNNQDDGSPASVFVYDPHKGGPTESLARNALKRSKTLRHPCLLQHVESSEASGAISLATESV